MTDCSAEDAARNEDGPVYRLEKLCPYKIINMMRE